VARKVKDQSLDSRTARGKLKARGKPYYRAIDPGLHLGYRKLRGGPGKWVVRLYIGDQNYELETIAKTLGVNIPNTLIGRADEVIE
jgi:hypothetical protein